MDFTKVSDAIKNSPSYIKNLIFSDQIGALVQDIAWKHGLDEDMALKLGDEVGYVILNLKSKFNFVDSITGLGINENDAKQIADEVESDIFSKIKNDELQKLKNIPGNVIGAQTVESEKETGSKSQPPKPDQPRTRIAPVGFEEAILNQARAMRPAEPVDGRIMNQELRIKQDVPHNLPTDNTPKIVHDYRSGNDPYREPLE